MQPRISIILSTFNALDRLKNCLLSITMQDYPLDQFEVVIIDDASSDQTEEFLKEKQYPFFIHYEKNASNMGRSFTRNRGIKASRGDILIFSDSDMILPPHFIKQHVAYHNAKDNRVVCGSFWNEVPANLNPQSIKKGEYAKLAKEKQWAWWFKGFQERFGTTLDYFYFPWMYFVIMNCSVRKEFIVKAGGFDENFHGYGGEDEEVGYRLYKMGLQFIMDAEIVNFHQEHPRSFSQKKESESNVDYILKKHPSLDTLLFYRLPEMDHYYKNDILHELTQIPDTNESVLFKEELRNMILKQTHFEQFSPSDSFFDILHELQLKYQFHNLFSFIKKLLKHNRRRRFR